MRAVAGALIALALGGCARMDQELARVRAQIALRDVPHPASEEPAQTAAPCVGAYAADVFDGTHELTHLGGVTFAELGGEESWRYATARTYARHLSRKDPARKEMLDNGAEFHVAHLAHVVVPGTRTATISVDEPLNFAKVGLIPGGVSQFGGYSATDGETLLRCEAEALTTTYPLGVVVEGPRCASITVQLDGEPPVSKSIPFGRRSCP